MQHNKTGVTETEVSSFSWGKAGAEQKSGECWTASWFYEIGYVRHVYLNKG